MPFFIVTTVKTSNHITAVKAMHKHGTSKFPAMHFTTSKMARRTNDSPTDDTTFRSFSSP
jgi:hypothetical protein